MSDHTMIPPEYYPGCSEKEFERLKRENAELRKELDEAYERAANQFPDNWCDPLLSGKGSVFSVTPNCPDIERLIEGIKERVMRLKSNVTKRDDND